MMLLHRFVSILRWVFHRNRSEQDLNDEMEAFVEMAAAEVASNRRRNAFGRVATALGSTTSDEMCATGSARFGGKEVWVAVHTKKDAGRLGNRILREAGVE